MKKVLLVLAVTFFLSAGFVTAKKIQNVNNNATELLSSVAVDDANAVTPFADDDEKKKAKKSKTAKCDVKDCKEKDCKEKCDKTAVKGEKAVKCDKTSAKKCCDKDKK